MCPVTIIFYSVSIFVLVPYSKSLFTPYNLYLMYIPEILLIRTKSEHVKEYKDERK